MRSNFEAGENAFAPTSCVGAFQRAEESHELRFFLQLGGHTTLMLEDRPARRVEVLSSAWGTDSSNEWRVILLVGG